MTIAFALWLSLGVIVTLYGLVIEATSAGDFYYGRDKDKKTNTSFPQTGFCREKERQDGGGEEKGQRLEESARRHTHSGLAD
ncbi:MAG: hypothetical protein HYV26_22155 [Candidatus Hydrogenedentes bacterium]|nr:hypothetical protein [Candidatus Hydrogenedentota bacterium]MBI3119426.1 hypothetical protein [Candidatus Hydrogenedentota bacterium]